MFGGHMGNPNPGKQEYLCQTCGVQIAPYQFYCEKHKEVGELYDKPLVIDRCMSWMFGRSKKQTTGKRPADG